MDKSLALLFLTTLFVNACLAQIPIADTAQHQNKEWSLEDCINYAIDNNITINQSKIDLMTAKNNLEQSKYNRLPTISASASQGYSTGQTIDPITSDFVSQSINSTSLGASANVVLFRGGYINNTIEKNRVIVKQNEFYVDQAKNNIILSVIEAYVQALSYNEAIKIAEQTKENSMVQYQVADGKYKAGSLSGIDLSNYETQIATDNLTLVNAKNDYKTQILKLIFRNLSFKKIPHTYPLRMNCT
jgi:outer membrane protein